MLTDAKLIELFPYGGGKELALGGIRHCGEETFCQDVLPIYRAICRIQEEEYGDAPCVSYLAEALQYRDRARLESLADYGLFPDERHLLEYGRGCHAAAVRAEAVRRVLYGEPPGHRALFARHDVVRGGTPLMPHDKVVMDLFARREEKTV